MEELRKRWRRDDCADRESLASGFTLIEIALVLAVISILAVVTIPKYEGVVEHYRLESSAQSLVGVLRYAQQLAVEQRSTAYVGLTTDGAQIILQNPQNGTLELMGEKTLWQSGVQLGSTLGLGEVPEIGSLTFKNGLSYNWQGFVGVTGASLTTQDLDIVLLGNLGDKVDIEIGAFTGNISVVGP